MVNKKKKNGHQWHKKQEEEAILKISGALLDGKWHQYKELLEQTKISKATLSKHLKNMQTEEKIDRLVDIESGAYPPPVKYKTKEDPEWLKFLAKQYQKMQSSVEEAKTALLKTSDPMDYFPIMNRSINVNLLALVKGILDVKEGKLGEISNLDEKVNLWVKLLLVSTFENFVWTFIQTLEPSIKNMSLE